MTSTGHGDQKAKTETRKSKHSPEGGSRQVNVREEEMYRRKHHKINRRVNRYLIRKCRGWKKKKIIVRMGDAKLRGDLGVMSVGSPFSK